jgi:Family of unknown function (DUF5946)
MRADEERCVCGLVAPPVAGEVDAYKAATPACWAAFGRLLAGDYTQWQPRRHRLTVDAYMAQHPGFATPAGRRSVIVHLIGIWLTLERGLPPEEAGPIVGQVFPDKSVAPPELAPIPALAGINVTDVLNAPADQQEARVETWARFVWTAWRPHHPTVLRLGETLLERSRAETRR